MKKNLVICPNCERVGNRQVLGEVDQAGNFLVMRFRKGMTKIVGAQFAVVCEQCGEAIYIHNTERRLNEGSDIRGFWLYRFSSSGGTYEQRSEGQGTA